MRKYFYYTLLFLGSCKSQPESKREYDKYDPDKTYKLQLNPGSGAAYHYDITNESEIKIEVDGKKVNTINNTNIGANYKAGKDSSGNFIFSVAYDKIQIHTKTGDKESDADAANAAASIDPVEKMLGILKDAVIVTTVKPNGEIVNITGYKEISDKIMASFSSRDEMSGNLIKTQLDKLVEDRLIKNNLNQFFKIFPDSVVHLNDSWRQTSKQEGELNLTIKSLYTLKAINSDIAIIQSEGTITSDGNTISSMGFAGGIMSELKGKQEAEFEMEAKTGMLIGCKIRANIEGTIRIMGREVPVKITNTVKMNGRKMK
jgi:hypothetical protein